MCVRKEGIKNKSSLTYILENENEPLALQIHVFNANKSGRQEMSY